MYKTKVLLVGGAGYLGGWITEYIKNIPQIDFTIYDNLSFHDFYTKPDVKFIYGDVRDQNKLDKIINDYDIVVWLAAYVGDKACTVNPKDTEDINVESLKWLKDNYKGRIIWPSSCSVYGKNDNLIDENSPVNPLSLYAETKVKGEEILKGRALILRLGTLYGLADPYGRQRLDLVGNLLICKGFYDKKLTVFGGEQYRPIVHVSDIACFISSIIISNNQTNGIYNLGHANVRLADLAKQINFYIDGCQVIETDIPTEDFRNYKVLDDKARTELAYKNYLDYDFHIIEMLDLLDQNRLKNWKSPIYYNYEWMNKIYGK